MRNKKIDHLQNIIESLEKMPEEKYNHLKNWKYLQFTKNGDYFGYSHFKINLPNIPGLDLGPLFYLVPMLTKKNTIDALKARSEEINKGQLLAEKKGFISQQQIEVYLFGRFSDNHNRLSRFYEISDKLKPEDFWPTFRRVYDVSAKKYCYRQELRNTFNSDIPQIHRLMSKEEKCVLDSLDDKVTIYRAMAAKEGALQDYGLSWTLYEDLAAHIGEAIFKDIWYQGRFFIKELTVNKSDLHAFFNDRNMWELVYVQRKEEIPGQYLETAIIPL